MGVGVLSTVRGEIAVFYALDSDLAALRKEGVAVGAPKTIQGQVVTSFDIGGHRVRAVKMESGSVPTAISAMALLGRFPCDLAVSIGPAGRIGDRFSVGEWVRVREVVCFQEGAWTSAGFFVGKDAVRALEPPPSGGSTLPKPWTDCAEARVASGSVFSASREFRDQLRVESEAELIDMNLAGLVAACAAARVPLVCWKIVSDSADDTAFADFPKFCDSYAGEGGKLVAEWIERLPPNLKNVSSHPNLHQMLEQVQ